MKRRSFLKIIGLGIGGATLPVSIYGSLDKTINTISTPEQTTKDALRISNDQFKIIVKTNKGDLFFNVPYEIEQNGTELIYKAYDSVQFEAQEDVIIKEIFTKIPFFHKSSDVKLWPNYGEQIICINKGTAVTINYV